MFKVSCAQCGFTRRKRDLTCAEEIAQLHNLLRGCESVTVLDMNSGRTWNLAQAVADIKKALEGAS